MNPNTVDQSQRVGPGEPKLQKAERIFTALKQSDIGAGFPEDFNTFYNKVDPKLAGDLYDVISANPFLGNALKFERDEFAATFDKKKDFAIPPPTFVGQSESDVSTENISDGSSSAPDRNVANIEAGIAKEVQKSPTIGDRVSGFVSSVDRGVLGIIPDALQFIGQIEYGFNIGTSAVGLDKKKESVDETLGGTASNFLRDVLHDLTPIPDNVKDEIFVQAGQGVGQIITLAAASPLKAAQVLGQSSKILTGKEIAKNIAKQLTTRQSNIASTQMATHGFANAKEQGATDGEAFLKMLADAGIGKTDAIPVGRMLDRVNNATGGGITRWAVKTTTGTAEEAFQEAFQEWSSNVAEREIFNEGKKLIDGVVPAGQVGGASGLIINAFLNALTGRKGAQVSRLRDYAKKKSDEQQTGENKAIEDLGESIDKNKKALAEGIRNQKKPIDEESNVEVDVDEKPAAKEAPKKADPTPAKETSKVTAKKPKKAGEITAESVIKSKKNAKKQSKSTDLKSVETEKSVDTKEKSTSVDQGKGVKVDRPKDRSIRGQIEQKTNEILKLEPKVKQLKGRGLPITATKDSREIFKKYDQAKADLEVLKTERRKQEAANKEQPTKFETVQTEIGQINQEINDLKVRLTTAKKNDQIKNGKPVGKLPKEISTIPQQIEILKGKKADLDAKLQATEDIQGKLRSKTSDSIRLKLEKENRDKSGVTTAEYTFSDKGLSGSMISETSPEGKTTFFASNQDGTVLTEGHDNPVAAMKQLQREAPKNFTQTGKVVVAEGQDITESQKTLSENLKETDNFVRGVARPRKEGEIDREFRLALKDKSGSGRLKSVKITPRGTVKFSTAAERDQFKKDFPDTWKTIESKSEVATPDVPKSDIQRKSKKVAESIRKGKIKVPKGVLSASSGIDLVWNNALEIVATTIEAGGDFFEAMRKAARHIRTSAAYRKLSPEAQAKIVPELERVVQEEFVRQDIPFKAVRIEAEVKSESQKLKEWFSEFKTNASNLFGTDAELKDLKNEIREFIFKRRAFIDTNTFQSVLFKDKINEAIAPVAKETGVSAKSLREIVPFMIEGAKSIPKELNRPDLQEAWKHRTKLAPIVKETRSYFDQMWSVITANTDQFSEDQIKDYITHIWEIPSNVNVDKVAQGFTTKNRFMQKRYIETLVEGVKRFGLTPKVLDINEIIRIHADMSIKAAANKTFVDDVSGLKLSGATIFRLAKDAPLTWGIMNTPALQAYRVHPDAKPFLDAVLDTKIASQGGKFSALARGYDLFDGFLKRVNLAFSFFHHLALSEAAIAGSKNPIKTGKLIIGEGVNFVKQIGNDTPSNMFSQRFPDITMDALNHNLQLGITQDLPEVVRANAIESLADKAIALGKEQGASKAAMKRGLSKVTGAGGVGLKGLGITVDRMDRFLWDYLHDGMKLQAYADAVSKIPAKFNTPELITKYKRERSQFINDTFGGQNWDVLFFSRNNVRLMRRALLSPDWTISTMRQAFAAVPFIGRTTALFPETSGERSRVARMFWLRAFVIFGTLVNALNAYFRAEDFEENPDKYIGDDGQPVKKLSPKDLSMFGNTMGHGTHLFMGRYADGSERYLRWGKQFRELPEFIFNEYGDVGWIQQLLKKLGGKMAPILQLLTTATTGKSLSGFENWDLKDKKGLEHTIELMKLLAKSSIPFSSNTLIRDDKEFNVTDLVMPSSKGASFTKIRELMRKHIYEYGRRVDGTYDPSDLIEIFSNAVRNDIDPVKAFDIAVRSVQADYQLELSKLTKDVEAIEAELKSTQNPEQAKLLTERLKKKLKAERELEINKTKLGKVILQSDKFVTQRQRLNK